jgi:hypothetical protein
MFNRNFTPEEIAVATAYDIPEVTYEISENVIVVKHFEEDFPISGQVFVLENGDIIAHTTSSSHIYKAADLEDALAYVADVVLTSCEED